MPTALWLVCRIGTIAAMKGLAIGCPICVVPQPRIVDSAPVETTFVRRRFATGARVVEGPPQVGCHITVTKTTVASHELHGPEYGYGQGVGEQSSLPHRVVVVAEQISDPQADSPWKAEGLLREDVPQTMASRR